MKVKGMVVVMTFSVVAWKSLGLKWTTETLHTNCCHGQDKILMWNCSLEKEETIQNSLWFFNLSTEIAYVSESGKFYVRDLYKSRVEPIDKMGIRLKNVSSIDTGNYSLYLNLGPEPPENMQTIFLTVIEAPRYQCKPNITKYSENVLFCSTNSCGGMQLSTEWRILERYDFVSNADYLKINSSWNDEHVLCCLHRQYMQCQNGNLLDFCASTFIFFAEAPDSRYTENSENLTTAVIVLAITNFLSIVVICFIYRKKIYRLYSKRCKDTDKVQEPNELETLPMMRGAKQHEDEDLQLEPKTVVECSPLREGAKQHEDANIQRRPNIAVECSPLMEDAKQHEDANIQREPNTVVECSPLMEGAKQHEDANIQRELNTVVECSPLMEDSKRCKDTDMVQENNNEPETRSLM